jgi:hypothetical protein
MCKFLPLLISLFVFAFAPIAQAEETSLLDNFSVTGFAYVTDFGDHAWHEQRSTLAVNTDWFVGNFAIRSQVSTYEDQNVRRLTAEYSEPFFDRFELIGRVGRFTRVDTFYNGISDSPSNWRQAILPFAGYSYRMHNGSFVVMDGAQVQGNWKINSKYLLSARYSKGAGAIGNQDDIQNEIFSSRPPKDLFVDSANDNESYSLRLFADKWEAYVSRDDYHYNLVALKNTAVTRFYTKNFKDLTYRVDKLGFRFDNDKYLLQTEVFHDYFNSFNTVGIQTSDKNAVGTAALGGYYITDNLISYVGRSYARSREKESHQADSFVGMTWNHSPVTMSVEWHKGEGFAWRKYGFIIVPAGELPEWNTWVYSLTYVF